MAGKIMASISETKQPFEGLFPHMSNILTIFSCRLAGKLWLSILLLSLLLSFSNVYPLASYECEWHNSFDQSYMFDLVQTFSNLFCSIIHVQTCSNFFKLIQTHSNSFTLVQTCSNLFKLVETCSNLFKLFLICSNLFKFF